MSSVSFTAQLSGFPFTHYMYYLNKTVELWDMYNAIADGKGVVIEQSYADGSVKSWERIQERALAETMARPQRFDVAMAKADKPNFGLSAMYADGTVKSTTTLTRSRTRQAFYNPSGQILDIVI